MDEKILEQISVLQDIQSKAVSTAGFYGDISLAIAALQICNTYGIDSTARFISDLKTNGIKTNEELRDILSNISILSERKPFIKDDVYICPHCNIELNNISKHCGNCGQKINWIEYATSTKNQI